MEQHSNDLPLVSVITGYYNRTEDLKASIQSILDQSYPNFEYIVFDDCSTDATSDLLREFSDPRLKLYRHSENMGFTKGAIQAVSRATGEYIAFHGAGDISAPTRIEKQVSLLNSKPNVGIVGCLIEDIFNEKSSIYTPTKNGFTHGEVMYRRELYYRAGGYNALFPIGQFTYLKAEILKLSEGDFVNEVLYKRRHFSNGITKNPHKRFRQKFMIKAGVFLSNNDESLYAFDKNRIFLEAYISLLSEDSPADTSEFLSLYTGNPIISILTKAYRLGLLPNQLFQRLLGRFAKLEGQ